MKVARVVLELSIPRRRLTRRQFRDHILKKEVREDPRSYLERISRTAEIAAVAAADLVLLPAYAFPCERKGLTRHHWERIPRRLGLKCLVGGAYSPHVAASATELWRQEHIFAATQKESLVPEHHYGPLPLMLGGERLILAISSSVKNVEWYPHIYRSLFNPATPKSPLVILDMGHDQYGSRYKRRLRSVTSCLSREGSNRNHLFVSSWRWRGSSIGTWGLSRGANSAFEKRLKVPLIDGRVDYVDIFHVT